METTTDPLTTWQDAEVRARAARVRAYAAGLRGNASIPADAQFRAQQLRERAHAALKDYLRDMERRALSKVRYW